MAAGSGEDKTEKASPKKRKDARKEGQIARTPEIGAWGSLLVLAMFGPMLVRSEVGRWAALMTRAARFPRDPTVAGALQFLSDASVAAVRSIVVLGLIVMLVGVLGALAQGGFLFAPKVLKPSFKHFNLIEGSKRLFGPMAWWNAVKMLVKTTIVGLVVFNIVRAIVPILGRLNPAAATIQAAEGRIITMVRWAAVVGLAMALVDYAIVWRRTNKQIKMTKTEVKQENKQAEGDPLLKSAIRSRQLQASRNRMLQAVPEADVLMVNPTHYAVALTYVSGHGAPRVVARGAGEIARRMRELARESEVPLVHDVPLTQALYRSTEVGQEIPAELFSAVAQVLAFVISRRAHGYWGGDLPSPRKDDVPDTAAARSRRRRRTSPTPSRGGGSGPVESTPGV